MRSRSDPHFVPLCRLSSPPRLGPLRAGKRPIGIRRRPSEAAFWHVDRRVNKHSGNSGDGRGIRIINTVLARRVVYAVMNTDAEAFRRDGGFLNHGEDSFKVS